MSVSFGMNLSYANKLTTCEKSFNDFSNISQLQGKVKSVEVCFSSNDSVIKNIIDTFVPSFDTFTGDLIGELESWGGLSYEVFERGYNSSSESHNTSYSKHISITVLKNPITKKSTSSASRIVVSPYSNTTFYFTPVINGSDCIFFSYSSSNGGSIYSDSLFTSHSFNGIFLLDNIAETINITNTLTNCTSDKNNVTVGISQTITLTADNYFSFYSRNTPKININGVDSDFTIVNENTCQYNFTPQSGDIISVNATATATELLLTKNLTNCSTETTVLYLRQSNTITLTANSGYIFDENNKPVLNADLIEDKTVFTLSQDKTTATATLIPQYNTDYTITGVANRNVEIINISNSLSNCVSDTDSVEVDGTQKTITLTADKGYYFNAIPTISINNVTNNFSLTQDKTSASYSFIPVSGDVISVNASAIIQPKQAIVTTHLTNCVVSPDISVFTEHSQVTLTLTCSENYSFQDIPYIDENITKGTTEKQQFTKINNREYSLTLPTGDFYTVSGVQTEYTIDIYATAIFDSETVNKYGLVLLYKPNKDILKDLSLVRFVNVSTGVTEDLGQYITSLKRIYLDVGSVGSANIICGKNDTGILCPMIDDDDVILDLGNVSINGLYQNGLDNKNLDIDLILPFIGVVKLDSAIMANKTINIKYKCNLITGVCVAYVYLVENETLHLQEKYNGDIGFDVPYILKTDTVQVYNSTVDSESIFNVPPQIKLYENAKASINNSIYNTDLIIKVGDVPNGFFSIEKIINSNNNRIILSEELKEIENILRKGVEI